MFFPLVVCKVFHGVLLGWHVSWNNQVGFPGFLSSLLAHLESSIFQLKFNPFSGRGTQSSRDRSQCCAFSPHKKYNKSHSRTIRSVRSVQKMHTAITCNNCVEAPQDPALGIAQAATAALKETVVVRMEAAMVSSSSRKVLWSTLIT